MNESYYAQKEFAEKHPSFVSQIMGSLPICLKIFDKDFNLVYINAGGMREHLLTPEMDLSKFNYLSTIVERDREKVRATAKQAFGGETVFTEFEHIPGKSRQEWCFSVLAPVLRSGSDVEYISMTSLDFTTYAQAERILERERRMFKLLLDANPLCIKWFDGGRKLISVNRAGREEHHLEDMTEDEVRNWNYMECIEPEYRKTIDEKIDAALKGQASGPFLIKHVPGTSTGTWCRSNIIPVNDEEGNVELVLFTSQDVTEEREAARVKAGQMKELEDLNKVMIGREVRMAELKKENELLRQKLAVLEAKKASRL
ncbi:MAG: PAS domain-containing protein [Patescibacteria group bacterium]|nr:PAS domain-containing protein [Patescibacteria group bacterium]